MISGNFVDKFRYGNVVVMVDVPAEDSEDFDIVEVRDGEVLLAGNIVRKILCDKDGSEYIIMCKKGIYEEVFRGGKPSNVKCVPFLDDYNEHPFKPEVAPLKDFKKPIISEEEIERMRDTSLRHATCSECGFKKMDYVASTYTYHCPKCGNILEV